MIVLLNVTIMREINVIGFTGDAEEIGKQKHEDQSKFHSVCIVRGAMTRKSPSA